MVPPAWVGLGRVPLVGRPVGRGAGGGCRPVGRAAYRRPGSCSGRCRVRVWATPWVRAARRQRRRSRSVLNFAVKPLAVVRACCGSLFRPELWDAGVGWLPASSRSRPPRSSVNIPARAGGRAAAARRRPRAARTAPVAPGGAAVGQRRVPGPGVRPRVGARPDRGLAAAPRARRAGGGRRPGGRRADLDAVRVPHAVLHGRPDRADDQPAEAPATILFAKFVYPLLLLSPGVLVRTRTRRSGTARRWSASSPPYLGEAGGVGCW